jgi:hypothetical protein
MSTKNMTNSSPVEAAPVQQPSNSRPPRLEDKRGAPQVPVQSGVTNRPQAAPRQQPRQSRQKDRKASPKRSKGPKDTQVGTHTHTHTTLANPSLLHIGPGCKITPRKLARLATERNGKPRIK